MTDFAALPHGLDARSRTLNAVIEASRGTRSKVAWAPDLGVFALHHVLPEGLAYPMDFGFVPSTLAPDGDPLDIMVMADEPLPVGIVARVRLLGVLGARQWDESGHEERNDRLIGVAAASLRYARVRRLTELGDGFAEQLTGFWQQANALRGRRFEVIGFQPSATAVQAVRVAML